MKYSIPTLYLPLAPRFAGQRLALVDLRHEKSAGAKRALDGYPLLRVNGHSLASTSSYRAVLVDDLPYLGQRAGRSIKAVASVTF